MIALHKESFELFEVRVMNIQEDETNMPGYSIGQISMFNPMITPSALITPQGLLMSSFLEHFEIVGFL